MTIAELRTLRQIISQIIWFETFKISWTWKYEGNILKLVWNDGKDAYVFFIGAVDFNQFIKPLLP